MKYICFFFLTFVASKTHLVLVVVRWSPCLSRWTFVCLFLLLLFTYYNFHFLRLEKVKREMVKDVWVFSLWDELWIHTRSSDPDEIGSTSEASDIPLPRGKISVNSHIPFCELQIVTPQKKKKKKKMGLFFLVVRRKSLGLGLTLLVVADFIIVWRK